MKKCLLLLLGSIVFHVMTGAAQVKVLVMASRDKDHKNMIAAARPWFAQLAATQHYQIDFSDDTSLINAANLRHYEVFVQLQLAPFDISDQQQAALQQYIEDGNGWVGIHAAGLTGSEFYAKGRKNWQWFEDFMGGVKYSPHPAFQQGVVKIEDTLHPLMKGVPATFRIGDEWYEFDRSPRGNVHVLGLADESSYHQNKPMGDHPIIWTNENYPRTVYIGVGHSPEVFASKDYTTLLQNAIHIAATPLKIMHALVLLHHATLFRHVVLWAGSK